jgi:UDP-glucose 4-epimerase
LRGEAPILYDSGRQTRCFTYVDDAIEGVIRASRYEAAIGEAFNIGRAVESSMAELVQTVIEESGKELAPEPFDTREKYGAVYEDIERRVPKVDKARALLGWEAETDLRTGVRKSIEWAHANPWWLADR